MGKYCTKCGNELGEGQLFCGNCGSRVSASEQVGTVKTTDENNLAKLIKLLIGTLLAVVVVLVIVVIAFVGGNDKVETNVVNIETETYDEAETHDESEEVKKEQHHNFMETSATEIKMDSNAVQAILNGQQKFVEFESGIEVTLETLSAVNSYYIGNPGRYTTVDLDNNGANELLIEYDMAGDTAIINIQDGKYVAYYMPYRAITGLKSDGTMSWSNGATESGVQRLTFGNDGVVSTNTIVYSPDNFLVNGKSVTEDECKQALSMQMLKQEPEWTEVF